MMNTTLDGALASYTCDITDLCESGSSWCICDSGDSFNLKIDMLMDRQTVEISKPAVLAISPSVVFCLIG